MLFKDHGNQIIYAQTGYLYDWQTLPFASHISVHGPLPFYYLPWRPCP